MKFQKLSRGPARRGNTGFTLIEILVVIAIIAILAAAFIVAAGQAINAAKRAKANVIATQIQAAILNYQTEYGLYPIPSTAAAATDTYFSDGDSTDWQNLCNALCGNISAYDNSSKTGLTVSNTRVIAYLTPKKSDVDSNGILLNPFFSSTATASSNPYFYLVMDADYDGLCGDTSATKLPDFTNWSSGTLYSAAPTLAKGNTQGASLWVDCDSKSLPPSEASSKVPGQWIHTY